MSGFFLVIFFGFEAVGTCVVVGDHQEAMAPAVAAAVAAMFSIDPHAALALVVAVVVAPAVVVVVVGVVGIVDSESSLEHLKRILHAFCHSCTQMCT
jgi:hypothetical protein